MKRLKNNESGEQQQKTASKPGVLMRLFIHILDGTFLSKRVGFRQVAYGLFMALLGILYIANSYQAEKTIRRTARIADEIKEFRSEHVSLKSELMFKSNQSEVALIAGSRIGLIESKQPPHKLFVPTAETPEEN